MSTWQVGSEIDGYRLLEQIGEGGMGVVFRAARAGGSHCCLKALTIPNDPELATRFRREGEAQARVDAHPNVVRVHALGVAAGRPYLVSDLADGGDLSDRLRHGPLPFRAAVELVQELARGLAHVHAQGVLHRDLKPANVLFADGVPQLTDFGIAKIAGTESLTATGAMLGTPAYMAPEQLTGRGDERADVYGLGAILYHCLTGQPPFVGSPIGVLAQVATEAPVPPARVVPEIPPGVSAVCSRALAKQPEERFRTATELSEALGAAVEGLAETGAARWWIAAAALLVGVVVAGGVVAARQPVPAPAGATSLASGSPAPTVSPTPTPSAAPGSPGGLVRRLRALSAAEQAALRALRTQVAADVPVADRPRFWIDRGARYLAGGERRLAIAAYRAALSEKEVLKLLEQVFAPLSELLLRVQEAKRELARYTVEGAVRGQGWALRAIAAAGLGHVDWRRVLPDVTPAIGAAAAVVHVQDGHGAVPEPEPVLRLGAARRRLEGFLVRRLVAPQDKQALRLLVNDELERALPQPFLGGQLTSVAKHTLMAEGVNPKVLALFRLAAANRSPSGFMHLTEIYAKGEGVKINPELARRLLLTGALDRTPRCLVMVGIGSLRPFDPKGWLRVLQLREDRAFAAHCFGVAMMRSDADERKRLEEMAKSAGLDLPKDPDPPIEAQFAIYGSRPWLE